MRHKQRLIAVHDCPFPMSDWQDPNFSMSWLNALSNLQHRNECIVEGIVSDGSQVTQWDLAGVHLRFVPPDKIWEEVLTQVVLGVDILYLNLMDYNFALEQVRRSKHLSPQTKIVFRIHHEPFRLGYLQKGFIDCLRLADLVIAPLPIYREYLNSLLDCEVISLPFGANDKYFTSRTNQRNHNGAIVTFSKNTNPGKNVETSKRLESKNFEPYQFLSFLNLPRNELLEVMSDASFLFQPSLSEASGSRLLFEGLLMGLVPICFKQSTSCSYIVSDSGGIVIDHPFSRTYLDMEPINLLESEVDDIFKKMNSGIGNFTGPLWIPPYIKESFEIEVLSKILQNILYGIPNLDISSQVDLVISNKIDRGIREEIGQTLISS